MTTTTGPDPTGPDRAGDTGTDSAPRVFVDTDLRGARFVRADLSGAVMRAVDVQGADIDAPWLTEGDGALLVNGVDVVAFVEAELNRRFPGRGGRRPTDPEGLRANWADLERTWAATWSGSRRCPPAPSMSPSTANSRLRRPCGT